MNNQFQELSRQPSSATSMSPEPQEIERPRIQAHLAIEADGAIFEINELDFIGFNNNPNGLSIRLKFPGNFQDFKFKRTKIKFVQSVLTSPVSSVTGDANDFVNHPTTAGFQSDAQQQVVNYNNDVETDDIVYPRTSQISSYEGMQIRGGRAIWTPSSVSTPKRHGPYDFPAAHLGNSLESQLLPSHSGQPPDGQTVLDSQFSNIRLESQKSILSEDNMPGGSSRPQYLEDQTPTVVAEEVDQEKIVQNLNQELEVVRNQQEEGKETPTQLVKEDPDANDDAPKRVKKEKQPYQKPNLDELSKEGRLEYDRFSQSKEFYPVVIGKLKSGERYVTKWGKYGSQSVYNVWVTKKGRARTMNKVSNERMDPSIIQVNDPNYYKLVTENKELVVNVDTERKMRKEMTPLEKQETIKRNFLTLIKMHDDQMMKNYVENVRFQDKNLGKILSNFLENKLLENEGLMDESSNKLFHKGRAIRTVIQTFCDKNNVDFKQQLQRQEFEDLIQKEEPLPEEDLESYVGQHLSLIKLIKDRPKKTMKVTKKTSDL